MTTPIDEAALAPATRERFTPDELTAEILADVVAEVAGPGALPRPGQAMLAADISTTLSGDGEHLAGVAPTGTGKSFAYLAAAAAHASLHKARTVVSTESLALQSQIVDKDAPRIAASAKKLTGEDVKVALHKGLGNYVCARSLAKRLETMTGIAPTATPDGYDLAMNALAASTSVDAAEFDLLSWAVQAVALNDPRMGDRSAFDKPMPNGAWEEVSVSAAECKGASKCPFAKMCLPLKARAEAAEADVVVTNHTMLGIQTAHSIPAIVGSPNLGEFDNIIVDEAHGLPAAVRNQGSVEVSGATVTRMAAMILRLVDSNHEAAEYLLHTADAIAEQIDNDLEEHMGSAGKFDQVVKLGEGEVALDEATSSSLAALIEHLRANSGRIAGGLGERGADELKRIQIRCNEVASALQSVQKYAPGTARWVERVERRNGQTTLVTRSTPVDVSAMLRHRLYSTEELGGPATDPNADPDEVELVEAESPEPVRLNVAAVSATLPKGFTREAGLTCRAGSYDSPFGSAYERSALFVPRAAEDEDKAALENRWGKFDTKQHVEWAQRHIVELVSANGGSALVLAATAAAGKRYAEALRRSVPMRVHSQWDALSTRLSVQAWKDDQGSIMVGTRSLMTGVDAPGETCSLVIVDRPARAASNPVDDARVDTLVDAAEMDRWTADRLVYVADAATLLDQAAGRLIRSIGDSGMVAVLDPRLLRRGTAFKYQSKTREAYMEPLEKFGSKFSDLEKATTWLRQRKEA